MYRPTIRYDDIFREYVDSLFRVTNLDRNQIIRGALFSAAHSKEFRELLEPYRKKDVPFPSPTWELNEDPYWMEQCPKKRGKGRDVSVKHRGARTDSEATHNIIGRDSEGSGCFGTVKGRERQISTQRIAIKEQGRITFTFN